MREALKGLLLSGVLLALTGCGGMTGYWKFDSIEPQAAQGDFRISELCLNDDGTYCAETSYGGTTKCAAGTYEYDKTTRMLTFKSSAGAEHRYKAEMCCAGSGLKIWSAEEDQDWTARMVRTKGCTCGGKACDPSKCKGHEE